MVDNNLIAELDVDLSQAEVMIAAELGQEVADGAMDGLLGEQISDFQPGQILTGKIIGHAGDDFLVEIGLKSEGVLDRHEFDEPQAVQVGDAVDVLLEDVEEEGGGVRISKRKADRIRGWERVVTEKGEGDEVNGRVMRKIKGGLLVDIGVPVFLPASQVDIRRPADIGIFIGKTIDAQVLKIDRERRNIVISRRKLLEDHRNVAREKLLSTLEEGQIIKGTVKNIADFGAFVDLGGIDGLLHITDMSWGRVNHPSEIVRMDDIIECKVLKIDRQKEKIALGLKQAEESPWEEIESKYPVNTRVKGEVTNIMSYGAFVKLEDGIEGLVHISEMSWTRRINHPSELVSVGEAIDVVVLDINKDKQEISLGMKQTEVNPWELVVDKYPPGTLVEGVVRNLASYGAFIEIEPGIDGLLHVSDLSWTKKLTHPNELLKKGETIKCVVLEVDQEKQRISLGLKQMSEDPWNEAIPAHYQPGMIVRGKVTKITNFGVFVELEDDLEGLLHISELADHKVEDPHDIVKQDETVEVKILRVDLDDRKIGLSLKRAQWTADVDDTPDGDPMSKASVGGPLGGGIGETHGAMGTDKISFGPGGAKVESATKEPAEGEQDAAAVSADEAPTDTGDAPVEDEVKSE